MFTNSQLRLVTVAMAIAFFTQSNSPRPAASPDLAKIGQAVIAAIDQNYLYARANPLWNIARQKILDGKYRDTAQAYRQIQDQLATLEDSELNLLTPAEIKATQSEALGEQVGSGLPDFAIDRNISSGEARVVTPVMGSPAMNARIEPGDIIVSVEGKATKDMSHEQVLDTLRAAATLHLELRRGQEPLPPVTLQTSQEKLKAVEFMPKVAGKKKIGYIRIVQFTPDTAAAVKDAIASLEKSGVSAYVLDLRNDPGGFLNAARQTAGLFASGTLGYKRTADNKHDAISTIGTPLTDKPLAVLINTGTASAAEFLAGGLQSLHRATLVGLHTYGRAQAQIFFPLTDDYGIQIPSVELMTAEQKPYKGKGIHPDVEVSQPSLPVKDLAGLRDRQFQRAVAELRKPAK